MNRINKFIILALIFFVHLFTGLNQAEGMVLCFEKDGSIQIEKAYKNSCISHIDTEHNESEDITKNHCSDCIDVPIFSEHTCTINNEKQFLSDNSQKIKELGKNLQLYLVYEFTENKRNFTNHPPETLLKTNQTTLESLDTVILLI